MTLVNEMAKWRYEKQSNWDKGSPDYDLELTTVDSVILRLNWVPKKFSLAMVAIIWKPAFRTLAGNNFSNKRKGRSANTLKALTSHTIFNPV